MSKSDIGVKLGVEGEREFKRQLKSINTDLKTLGTEMGRVTSEFIGNEKSVEALTAQNNVLGATAVELSQKQALLRDQLQKAAEAYGVADEHTQRLTQQYNKNEEQLNKTNAQIASNEKEIQQLTEAEAKNENQTNSLTGGLAEFGEGAGGVSGILKALGVNVTGLTRNLGLSKEQTNLMSEALGGSGMSIAVAGAAAAGAIALAAKAVQEITGYLTEAVAAGTDYADNISTLSTNFHISAQKLQEYQYMAELTDTSLDTITGSISRLTKSMDKARDGNEDVNDAFAKLNIRITDSNGNFRDASEVFEEAVGALNRVHNETERDTIAMTLFGRSAMELNSLVQSMADGSFQDFKREAHELGYVLSDEELKALKDLDDEFVRLQRQQEAIQNQISAEMAPALLELSKQLLDVAQSVDWDEFGKMAANVIRDLTPLIIDMANAVAGLAGELVALYELGQSIKRSPTNDGAQYRNDGTIRDTGAARKSNDINVTINANYKSYDSQVVRDLSPQLSARETRRGSVL